MKCETVWLIACLSSDEDGVDTSAGDAEDGVGEGWVGEAVESRLSFYEKFQSWLKINMDTNCP